MPFPFVALILFAASTILGELMRPKTKPEDFSDVQINTADRDRPIPVLWGRRELRGGNIIWYGDFDSHVIKKKTLNSYIIGGLLLAGLFKQTLGYRYHVGFALAFCFGVVDKVYRIKFAEKTAWANEAGQTPTGALTVSKLDMYGGDEQSSGARGGVFSTVDFYPGDHAQTANAYLRSLDSLHSAYRGIFYMVWRGASDPTTVLSGNGSGKVLSGYIGNNPSLDSVTVEAERCPKALSGANPWYRIGNGDANPVECLYELLTNTEWGLGRNHGYGSSWAAAAQTVYNEGLGFSIVWDSAKSVKAMAQEILDHIGGIIITDNATGNWEIKLARADYNPATIPVLEAVAPGETATGYDCIIDVQDYACGAYDETTGGVKVTFEERLTDNNYQTGQAFVYDRANVDIQGQPITITLNYPGTTDYNVALKQGWRELIGRSVPLKKCKIITDTNGARLRPGDVFKLKWADYRVDSVIFRVLKVGKSTLAKGDVEIDVIQDIFSLGATVFTAPPLGSWNDPVGLPANVATAKLLEAPRHSSGDSRQVWAAALKPSGNTNYDLYGSEDNGTTYGLQNGGADFTPVGTLVNAITRGANTVDTTNQIVLNAVSGLGALEAASSSEVAGGANIALIEGTTDELIAFEGFTIDGSGHIVLNKVYRGILDTVPNAHSSGVRVWFLFYGAGSTPQSVNLANAFDYKTKMVTRSPKGELAQLSATVRSITLASRYLKPYPPGNIGTVNTSMAPGGAVVYLTDDFNDNSLDATKWQIEGSAGTALEQNARMEITATGTSNDKRLRSVNQINFTNCEYKAKVTNISLNGSAQCQLLVTDAAFTTFAHMFVSNTGLLVCVWNSTTVASFTYNATTHLYWKMLFTGSTTITYFTSPDGVTWTQQGTGTHTLTLTNKYAMLRIAEFGGQTGNCTGFFDDVSVAIPASIYSQTDDFNDNSLDVSKWQTYGGSHYTVNETGAQLLISADSTATGVGGLQSISTALNLTNRVMSVKLAQIVNQASQQNWFLITDGSRYLGFQIATTTINFTHSVSGSTSLTYDPVNHLYLRLRYDAVANTINWDTSPDGVTWTNRRSITSASTNFTFTAVQVDLQLNATTPGSTVTQIWDSFIFQDSTSTPASGAVTISWAHRNRLNQPQIIPQSTASIAGEAGQTYTVRVYGQTGTLLRTATGITGTSYDYTVAFELADTSSANTLQTQLTFEVSSVVGGIESLQRQKIVVTR
jgi:hypothetical protein